MPDDPNLAPDDPAAQTPPPNPNPNPSPISDELRELIKTEATRIAGDRTAILEQELADLRNRATQPPAPATPAKPNFVAPTKDEFYNDPAGSTAKIVESLLKETTKPLLDVASAMTKDRVMIDLKRKFSADPVYKKIIEKCESYIDQMVGQAPNDQTMNAALLSLAGAIQLGRIQGVSAADIFGNGSQVSVTVGDPNAPNGRIPPSSPPLPRPHDPNKPTRELTETERRVARNNNWTDQQYIDLMDPEGEMTIQTMDKILAKPPEVK